MNLCVNATDAMAEGGTLTLRTANLGDSQVEVVVEDTGCGMTPEVLDRALDPFFTTKAMDKGTGLGLSMAFTTMQAHAGHLSLQSKPGLGTRVCLRFPASVTRDLDGKTSLPPAPSAAPGLSVLLVDDDQLIRLATRMLLEVLGHGVQAAASGEEALALLEKGFRPEAVILDMNMPGLGGKGTLPQLRALCPTVPVILATGRADQEALDLVAAHARVTLLAKPFDLEELQDCLGRSQDQAFRAN